VVCRGEVEVRVIGYVRVSTDEQAASGAGLEAQREAILAECRRAGHELVEVVTDAGFSAKDLNRPGILDALERLASGEADGLMVAKLDRLSRSVLDFAGLVARAQSEGWALICLDLGVDTSTASGEMMANVLASFAQFERRLIGERTKAALAQKRAQGVTLGRPRKVSDSVRVLVDELREEGWTFRQIAGFLSDAGTPTAHGGCRWYPSTVRSLAS
jgi:DNA invertase Pin-like site-specific DNA recombinase